MKKQVLLLISLISFLFTAAQVVDKSYNTWSVRLERKDGKFVPFILERKMEMSKIVLYVINADERIPIKSVKMVGDSMFFSMPTFESSFRVRLQPNGDLVGTYIKGTSGKTQYWPLHGYKMKNRFDEVNGESKYNISGKWDVSITRANGTN